MPKLESQWNCPDDRNFISEKQMVHAFLYTDYIIDPHRHDFYEINIIMSGSGTHLIEDKIVHARKGDVFVIPPNVVHAYTDTRKMDVFHILIKSAFIQQHNEESSRIRGFHLLMEIEPFLRNQFHEEYFLHLSGSELVMLQADLEMIRDGGFCAMEDSEELKNHIMLKILYWMSLLLHKQIYSHDAGVPEQSIISVLEYIHTHYPEKITVELLAKIANMSRPTLMRKFKSLCGCSPMQYVTNYRKTQAQRMLQERKITKTQIAYECGFYDLSHMERVLSSRDGTERIDFPDVI